MTPVDRSAVIRRIAQRRRRPPARSGVRPATVEIFTRFVRLNPGVPADSPVPPRVWRAYDDSIARTGS